MQATIKVLLAAVNKMPYGKTIAGILSALAVAYMLWKGIPITVEVLQAE